MAKQPILSETADYYRAALTRHGATPKGVDWNSLESQLLRFTKLCSLFSEDERSFSLLDYGCGYGRLFEYLLGGSNLECYIGYDIVPEMLQAAAAKYGGVVGAGAPGSAPAIWLTTLPPTLVADYAVASGIFNVKQDRTYDEWKAYIIEVLDDLNRRSRRGFAFNILTSFSDAEYMKNHLYYADPCEWFVHCKNEYSKKVALLHDYELYEFTMIVRKE